MVLTRQPASLTSEPDPMSVGLICTSVRPIEFNAVDLPKDDGKIACVHSVSSCMFLHAIEMLLRLARLFESRNESNHKGKGAESCIIRIGQVIDDGMNRVASHDIVINTLSG